MNRPYIAPHRIGAALNDNAAFRPFTAAEERYLADVVADIRARNQLRRIHEREANQQAALVGIVALIPWAALAFGLGAF